MSRILEIRCDTCDEAREADQTASARCQDAPVMRSFAVARAVLHEHGLTDCRIGEDGDNFYVYCEGLASGYQFLGSFAGLDDLRAAIERRLAQDAVERLDEPPLLGGRFA